MSLTDSTKVDYLWKKVGYGVTKTDIPTNKEAYNESIASPLLIRGDKVWAESGNVPTIQPSAGNTSVVTIYNDSGNGSATVECTEDITATDNRTWKTGITDWIPPEFGSSYLVKVYVDDPGQSNPQSTGTQLFQAGSGNNDEWFFDYQSGVLNFNGANIPTVIGTGVTGKSVYVAGATYSGRFGVGSAGSIGNLSVSDTTISTINSNANIVLSPDGTGTVQIDSTSSFTLPTGNTTQRPGSPDTGAIRYNNETTNVEFYDGTNWSSVAEGATVDSQSITPDGSSSDYDLDYETTANGILVTMNGVAQTPTIAYTVSGNVISFNEVPLASDDVEIRFLAVAQVSTSGTVNTGNITELAYYSATANAVSSSGANLTWNGTDTLTVSGTLDATTIEIGTVATNLIPTSNVTYNLGNSTNRWNDLYLAGNTLYLGSVQLKSSGNNFQVFQSDGVTPATFEATIDTGAGNIEAGNVIANTAISAVTGTFTGNVSTGNVSGTNGTFTTVIGNANASSLTSGTVPSGRLTGSYNISVTSANTASSATTAGTVTTAAQPNITSVGNLSSLTVTGNVDAGNLNTTGITVTPTISTDEIVKTGSNAVGNIGSSTSYFNTIFADTFDGTATTAQYADLAEMFSPDQEYPAGTVMVFGGTNEITQCTEYADDKLIGVISTDPAYLMNKNLENGVPIAFAGRVPCQVVGPVAKGDILTTSTTPGYAEKLDANSWKPGIQVGKALESCDAGLHTIVVVVGL